MENDIGINLKLNLSHINIILASLSEVPFKVSAPIIETLRNQAQDQIDQHAAFNNMVEEAAALPETKTIEERRAKAKTASTVADAEKLDV